MERNFALLLLLLVVPERGRAVRRYVFSVWPFRDLLLGGLLGQILILEHAESTQSSLTAQATTISLFLVEQIVFLIGHASNADCFVAEATTC